MISSISISCVNCGNYLVVSKVNNVSYNVHFCIKCGFYGFTDDDCFTGNISPFASYLNCLIYI